MLSETQARLKHLMQRAAFGLGPTQWQAIQSFQPSDLVDRLLKGSQEIKILSIAKLPGDAQERFAEMEMMSKEEKRKKGRALLKDLNVAWMRRMASSEAQLREKMTLFWHDHFACRLRMVRLAQMQNNTFRMHALGSFRDMLHAVAKDPGMLQFLNNQQNRKDHPNENFAREVLELFTMGRGHYSESDIQEAARAFTGWGFNKKGTFVFRRFQHDFGEKTFLGQTGNWDGGDILDMILEQKQTARFITRKIYAYLVNPVLDEMQVNEWAEAFYASDYDIGALVESILKSEHFYLSAHRGARIKSPVEYLVGLMRLMNLDLVRTDGWIYLQRVLGQVLLQPPNVAGWPQEREWIDASTLMLRLRIPQALIITGALQAKAKDEFAGNEDLIKLQKALKGRAGRQFRAEIDWASMEAYLGNDGLETQVGRLMDIAIHSPKTAFTVEDVVGHLGTRQPNSQLKELCMRILCTPEFQVM